jgi:hypothetical protein
MISFHDKISPLGRNFSEIFGIWLEMIKISLLDLKVPV